MWVSRGGLNSTVMAGGLTVVGSSVVVVYSHSSRCMCMDGMTMMKRNRAESWTLSSRSGVANGTVCSKRKKSRGLVVVSELGGQYEDTFEDVKRQIQNYFTYKAVRTVMTQLYEMNPPLYRWFYDFVVSNKPGDGKRFLRSLAKEKQDLAERVMVTRLHLYGKWAKKCDHAEIYKEISDENLELMRERLMETVIWPTDDTNTEKTEA